MAAGALPGGIRVSAEVEPARTSPRESGSRVSGSRVPGDRAPSRRRRGLSGAGAAGARHRARLARHAHLGHRVRWRGNHVVELHHGLLVPPCVAGRHLARAHRQHLRHRRHGADRGADRRGRRDLPRGVRRPKHRRAHHRAEHHEPRGGAVDHLRAARARALRPHDGHGAQRAGGRVARWRCSCCRSSSSRRAKR